MAAREEFEELTGQLLGTAETTDMTKDPLQTGEGNSAKGVGEKTLLSAMYKMKETMEKTCKALRAGLNSYSWTVLLCSQSLQTR